MKKMILSLALCLAGSTAFAQAAGVQSWFKNLYKALTTETAQKYASRGMKLTSVAAVRGAPLGRQDPADPYWKGGISEQAAKSLARQRKDFASAVQLVMDGKNDEGRAALEKFETTYPKSAMLSDVKEAIAHIPAPEPKPAAEENCDIKAETAADCAKGKAGESAVPSALPSSSPK